MATTTAPTKTAAPKKTPVSFIERTKKQLSTAALRGTLKVEEIEALESHIAKLKALLA